MAHKEDGSTYLGVDVGGTKVLALLARADGSVIAEETRPTPQRDAESVIDAMAEAARRAMAKANVDVREVRGAGIAAAGIVDVNRGVVVHSPNLRALDGAKVIELFTRRLDLPTVIGNDANLSALAEYRYGAGKGVSPLVYLTISTGIGGGLILNGELYVGAQGFAAEMGHITVDAHGPYGASSMPGAWEALVSGTALERAALERMRAGEPSYMEAKLREGEDAVDAIAIFDAFRAGDPLARSIVENAIPYLGAGLASLVNVLNPAKILIGGGLSNEWRDYIEPGIALMQRYAIGGIGRDVVVERAALGAKVAALGGAALAADASRGAEASGASGTLC